MTLLVQTQKTIVVHCPDCGHYKSRHEKGAGCVICAYQILKGWQKPNTQCLKYFMSRIPQSEIDQARAVSKSTYGGKTRCATCLEIWWAHDGMLCPNGETLFVPLIGDPGKGADA